MIFNSEKPETIGLLNNSNRIIHKIYCHFRIRMRFQIHQYRRIQEEEAAKKIDYFIIICLGQEQQQ